MSKIAELAKRIYNKELFDLDTRFIKSLGDASARWHRVHEATGAVQGAPADAVEDCERLYDEPPVAWAPCSSPVSFSLDDVMNSATALASAVKRHSAELERNILEAQANSVPLPPIQPPALKRDERLRGTVLIALPKRLKRQRHFRRRLRALRDNGRLYDLNRWMLFPG